MNLLLIDESLQYCQSLEKLFSEAQFQTTSNFSTDIESVISQLTLQNFDLILLPESFHQWHGVDLLREIKRNLTIPQSALIMLCNKGDNGKILNYIQAGVHNVLVKSELTPSHLHQVVLQAKARSSLELQLHKSFEKVTYLAEHDSLTGIGNRYQFDQKLQDAVAHSEKMKRCVGLVVVNIEKFKLINNSYGHDTGDKLLNILSTSIKALLADNEQLFRLGGDEFAVLLSDLPYAHIDDINRRILNALQAPFIVNNHEVKLNVNMGVAFFPQNARNAQELLRSAVIAEQCAKNVGSNTLCFVDDDVKEQFHQRFQIENALRKAIDKDEFVLHFQPVYSSKSGKLVSCEALVRWQHPDQGLKFPDYFIEIAEESGLIIEMGRWIIDAALLQLSNWLQKMDDNITMALNISPQQLYDKELVDFLEKKRRQYRLLPSQIEVEITETVLLKNTSQVMKTLSALAAMGYKIALDDFGTGYSSIQHLHSFPISTVKIDRSLMPNPNSPSKSLFLLKGLVSMLKSMRLSIVAEGVEIADNVKLCRDLGVDRLQGYYFSKPISGGDFSKAILCKSSSTKTEKANC